MKLKKVGVKLILKAIQSIKYDYVKLLWVRCIDLKINKIIGD